jgi:regulator of protease activity HflC (stomatin/prohibitin superfamily)
LRFDTSQGARIACDHPYRPAAIARPPRTQPRGDARRSLTFLQEPAMVFVLSALLTLLAILLWQAAERKKRLGIVAATSLARAMLLVACVAGAVTLLECFTQIPAGHVGVVDFFGVVSDQTLRAGISPVNPMADVIKYSIQTQEHKESMQVLSREGLTIGLEVSALYRLNPDSAARVYKTVAGGDYETIILIPQFRSICRAVTASFQASALYSTERERLGATIQEELAKAVSPRGVTIENTPIRNVALPVQLTEAIEQKQKADQESQRMEFILTKEKQEADRKRIEAKGIADFQTIVAAGISENLLRWKGIEATEKLAGSANTKVIIVGAGKDGLPIILDTK